MRKFTMEQMLCDFAAELDLNNGLEAGKFYTEDAAH